jgi:YegS/Rv2252/BmrU family lipid kinase
MTAALTTLIILNPHAASGQAGRMWTDLEPLLWRELGELVVVVTQRPEDVAPHLNTAYDAGIRRVIAIGGDGTNHSLVNALLQINAAHADRERMVYGNLPVGTGRDWARGIGMPTRDLGAAARWIAQATPTALDVGQLVLDDHTEFFLNIASAGLGGEVTARVNRTPRRRPWTFLASTIASILTYQPPVLRVSLDGQPWQEQRAFILAVANGTTFGHGMKIAPNALPTDGLFDVLLVKAVQKLEILRALRRVYDGSHLTHPAVLHARASTVTVESSLPLRFEMDGEPVTGRSAEFRVRPGALDLLM